MFFYPSRLLFIISCLYKINIKEKTTNTASCLIQHGLMPFDWQHLWPHSLVKLISFTTGIQSKTIKINWDGFEAIARWMWSMVVRWLSCWWLKKLLDLDRFPFKTLWRVVLSSFSTILSTFKIINVHFEHTFWKFNVGEMSVFSYN